MKKIICPVCNEEFEENCEYVYIGVGRQQATANHCDNCDWYEGCEQDKA